MSMLPSDIPIPPPPGPTAEGWHAISDLFDCPKKYQFSQIRKIREPSNQLPSPLSIGLAFHAGRARWFTRNFSLSPETWTEIQGAIRHELARQELPSSLDSERRALIYMQEYMQYWGRLPKPQSIVTEHFIGPTPVLDLLHELGFSPTRTARLDDVSIYAEGGNGRWIGEAKTTSQTIDQSVDEYTLHGQPMLQLTLYKLAPQGEQLHGPVDGVMLDITQKTYDKLKPAKFARVALSISSYALKWYAEELVERLKLAREIDWNSKPSRNIASCTKSIGRARVACPFRELCRYGAAARGRFVDSNGLNLIAWRPSAGKEVPPWE